MGANTGLFQDLPCRLNLLHALGIDTTTLTIPDLSGRPQYLVDSWQPMKELLV